MDSDGVVYTLEAYLSDLSIIFYPTNIKGKQSTMKQSKTKRDNKFKSSKKKKKQQQQQQDRKMFELSLAF